MAASASSTEIIGTKLLKDIDVEEGSLEDLLRDLRTAHTPLRPRTGILELDELWNRHGGKLSITGRGLPLLYHIVNHLIDTLHGTVALVDVDGRFSPSHLNCDLQHVHVFRPQKTNLKATLEGVEGYMLYGQHGSKGREWVGTIVSGDAGGDIMAVWNGWLKVEREDTTKYGAGVIEAMEEKDRRQDVVNRSVWRAVSELGEFSWRDG